MKKKSLSVLAMSLVTASALLGGCKKKDGPKEGAKLESLSMSGLASGYMPGSSIPWDSLRVTADFDDNSSFTFSKFEFDVEAAVSSETQLLVFTEGLHAKEVLTEADNGEYKISGALPGSPETKLELGKIIVGEITADSYDLVSFANPSVVTAYNEAVATSAEEGQTSENGLKDAEQPFTVGTMNVFKFVPQVAFVSKTNPDDIQTGNHYRKTVVVKEIEGNTEKAALASDYQVVDEGFKFADSADGKTFKVKVSPTAFPKTISQRDASVEFTFKVQKGLNIYSAKELGALNLTHYTRADFDQVGTSNIVEHIGNTQKNSADNVYATIEGGQVSYDYMSYVEVWTKFLKDKGTFTDEELVAYQDVPAVFLQSPEISITPADIPSEYFIKEGEIPGEHGNELTGCLRDSARIYVPIVRDHSVEINGNYFSLRTDSIPLCKCNTYDAPNGQAFKPYTSDYTGMLFAGHATLIEFCGLCQDNNNQYVTNQVDTANGKIGIIRNLNSTGNTAKPSGAASDIDKKNNITGLMFTMTKYVGCLFENLNIKQYMIALSCEQMVGQGNIYAGGSVEQHNYAFINKCKVYDCSNCGIFNYENGGIRVEKSELKRFGGSAIINAGNDTQAGLRGSNTFVDTETVLENEIVGNEIYFSALTATTKVNEIKALNQLFEYYAAPMVKDNKMNLLAMQMDGDDYIFAENGAYWGSMYIGTNGYSVALLANANQAKIGSGKAIMFTESDEQFEYDMLNKPPYFERDGAPMLHVGMGGSAVISGRTLNMIMPIPNGSSFTLLGLTLKLYDAQ